MGWANWLEAVRGWRAGARRGSQRRAPQGRGIEALEIRNLLTVTFAEGGMLAVNDRNMAVVAVGDLDGDGDQDVLGLSHEPSVFPNAVFLNNGDGSFAEGRPLVIDGHPRTAVALADVDGDGDLDAFMTQNYRDTVLNTPQQHLVFLNDGLGNLSDSGQRLSVPASDYSDNSIDTDVALGDFDGDGDADALVTVEESHTQQLLLNDGTGLFSDSGQQFGTVNSSGPIAVGDLDGDGDLDVAVGSLIHFNSGSGTFSTVVLGATIPGVLGPGDVAFGDLDNDGDLDMVLFGRRDRVLMNDGTGQFQVTSQRFDDTRTAGAVALGDLDGDGDLDLIATDGISGSDIFLNVGTGTFVKALQILNATTTEFHPADHDVSLADLDNDGDLDVVLGTEATSIFLNQYTPPEVTLPAGGGSYELLKSGEDFVLRTTAGVEIARAKLDDATQLLIRGSDGDDTLTVDFSGGNPIRAGRLTFENSRGDDRLFLIGGSATNAEHRFSGINEGLVNLDGRTINYSGVDLLGDHLTTTNRAFRLGSGNDSVELLNNGFVSDGRSLLDLFGGLMGVSLTNPSGSFAIYAGAGDDTVTLFGADALLACPVQVFGEEGHDVLKGLMTGDLLDGGAGNDVLNGRGGNDTLLGGDGLDTLMGGAGHDSLTGGDQHDKLSGQAGNDSLSGGQGNDLLTGDAGRDSLVGGEGQDTLRAGEGIDTLQGDAGRDLLVGGAGNDRLDGGADDDWLQGEDGNDSLVGSSGNDVLQGGTGRDTLLGGDGDDRMLGGSNNDLLLGGLGNDSLDGGLGTDTLAGNDGDDVIVGLPSEIDEAFGA